MRWTSRVLHSSTPYLSLSFGPSISLHFISCVEFLLPLGPSLARRIIPFSSFAGDCLSLIIIILINYLLPLSVQSIPYYICTSTSTMETGHSAVSDCQRHQLVLSHSIPTYALSPLSTCLFVLIAMLTSKSFHSSEWPAKRHWTSKRLATAVIR